MAEAIQIQMHPRRRNLPNDNRLRAVSCISLFPFSDLEFWNKAVFHICKLHAGIDKRRYRAVEW